MGQWDESHKSVSVLHTISYKLSIYYWNNLITVINFDKLISLEKQKMDQKCLRSTQPDPFCHVPKTTYFNPSPNTPIPSAMRLCQLYL